jgi:hypothetical protein
MVVWTTGRPSMQILAGVWPGGHICRLRCTPRLLPCHAPYPEPALRQCMVPQAPRCARGTLGPVPIGRTDHSCPVIGALRRLLCAYKQARGRRLRAADADTEPAEAPVVHEEDYGVCLCLCVCVCGGYMPCATPCLQPARLRRRRDRDLGRRERRGGGCCWAESSIRWRVARAYSRGM